MDAAHATTANAAGQRRRWIRLDRIWPPDFEESYRADALPVQPPPLGLSVAFEP
jgi:hypothetical protein